MGGVVACPDRCGGMNPIDIESPPALGAEGRAIDLGASVKSPYNIAGQRAIIERAVAALIDVLDMGAGDLDTEDDDPVEANGDELDQSYPEAAGPRAQAISGQLSRLKDAEDCDTAEDDDPGGCEHDGREHGRAVSARDGQAAPDARRIAFRALTGRIWRYSGKRTRVLAMLASGRTVTQWCAFPWHTRLGGTIHAFRGDWLSIETVREGRSRHACYRLLTPGRIELGS